MESKVFKKKASYQKLIIELPSFNDFSKQSELIANAIKIIEAKKVCQKCKKFCKRFCTKNLCRSCYNRDYYLKYKKGQK